MSEKKYWFKPARFWKYCAFYYPITFWGWFVTVFLLTVFIKIFILVDLGTHSGSDTLIGFAPWAIGIFIIFDIFCRFFGEYPWWWRKGAIK
jgi:hypothetical protein